jgi:hypothetical protein
MKTKPETVSLSALYLLQECSWLNARIRRDTERRERVIQLLREIDQRDARETVALAVALEPVF